MDINKIIGKIASDINNKKLGKIIRIDKLPGKTIKIHKSHAIILFEQRFREDIKVPLDVEKITKVETSYVWFDITKEDFMKEVKRISKIKTEREIYSGILVNEPSKTGWGRPVDVTGLSKSRKERKK
ncbi:MAG: hypothetical protein EAX90_02925 [Candidatus Heimdallarchaeota archaeon]|nr:hypothetical protein [Candidatus Heimdallarchaeota archaeon]